MSLSWEKIFVTLMLTRDLFVVDDVLAKCRADIQVHVRCRISKSVVTTC